VRRLKGTMMVMKIDSLTKGREAGSSCSAAPGPIRIVHAGHVKSTNQPKLVSNPIT
jgi:hypothetical protein